MLQKLTTPYVDLLPPLSTEEYEALKADIKRNGVRVPILVDEDGNILDGHHRYKIDKNAPTVVVSGLSESQKRALVIRSNLARRNLSFAQRKDLQTLQRKIAAALRQEDPKQWTQRAIAAELGVTQQCIAKWFGTNGTNTTRCITSAPDARVKVSPQHKPLITDRVARGESAVQVAADYGVTPRHIRSIVTVVNKEHAIQKQRRELAAQRSNDCGVICGDFRQAHDAAESVDLIFTDPPYDEASLGLYGELADYAAKVLTPGGWLLAYCGVMFLPNVYAIMADRGLSYGWTFMIQHSGGDARFRKWKFYNSWKPIVAFFKPPPSVHWDWFKDSVTGGREKSDHPWQQAVDEAAHFIERLCPEGGTVVDPFCGSGTTLLAAKRIGRRWMGYEIDPQHAETARSRLDERTRTDEKSRGGDTTRPSTETSNIPNT